jgi:hypothetical protein
MLILAALLVITPIETSRVKQPMLGVELAYAKKKRKASSSTGRKFSSCKAARKAGYSHMRRGQPGYSTNLDRDGDGVACDKVK